MGGGFVSIDLIDLIDSRGEKEGVAALAVSGDTDLVGLDLVWCFVSHHS